MAIKPILFNTEMVRAILDGRKTCTRRLPNKRVVEDYFSYEVWAMSVATDGCKKKTEKQFYEQYPPYQPGDILYVRETVWQKIGYYLDIDGETKPSWYNDFKYVASDEKPETGWNYSWAKRPSIHMPKEAARIWLKVANVRVERLQEISGEDLIKEGIDLFQSSYVRVAFDEFKNIWNSTIKKSDLDQYGWVANPYVFVIEFERCEKPEGEVK